MPNIPERDALDRIPMIYVCNNDYKKICRVLGVGEIPTLPLPPFPLPCRLCGEPREWVIDDDYYLQFVHELVMYGDSDSDKQPRGILNA